MLSLQYTPREQQIIALADELAARFAKRADHYDRYGAFPRENYTDLHTMGYLRWAVPTEYGGEGANLYETVLAQEHLAHGDGSTALAVDMTMHLIGRLAETRSWPEPIFAAVCHDIVTNGALINPAATEPEMGSPSRGGLPATTATPTTGGWLINGHKQFISMAPVLTYFAVSVQLPSSETLPEGGRGSAIVRAGSAGLRIVDTWSDALSLRLNGNSDLFLEDVFVPDEWLVDRQPRSGGPPKTTAQLAWFNLTLAAVYLGIGQGGCDAGCAYAHERTPSTLGKPIATLPNIQRRIGLMTSRLTAARSVLYNVAQTWVHQPNLRATLAPQIALAKYLCTNAAADATDEALRVAGGFGLSADLPLERYFRDARAGLTHPPHDDAALELLGRTALERG